MGFCVVCVWDPEVKSRKEKVGMREGVVGEGGRRGFGEIWQHKGSVLSKKNPLLTGSRNKPNTQNMAKN